MNIVKGVADLIRRTSNQTGESNSESRAERFPAPSPRICFSDTGDEAILSALWENYEHAVDKEEKKKLLRLFLKQFLLVFKNWEPLTSSQLSEVSLFTTSTLSHGDNTVIGCSIGHPAEIVHILIEEISQLTVTVAEMNVNIMQSLPNMSGTSVALNVMYDWVPVLDAFTIVIRSMHNCKVLGYYGGIQKLTALLKAAVVQLKTMTGALSADESLSNLAMENTRFLQRVLVYVVSIICSFIELDPNVYQVAQLYSKTFEVSTTEDHGSLVKQYNLRIPFLDRNLQWHPKAVVSVMEAGGLNWLVGKIWGKVHTLQFALFSSLTLFLLFPSSVFVLGLYDVSIAEFGVSAIEFDDDFSELVRVIRRLSMKEQWTDLALQYLSFRTLRSALWENPRGQNHFRSIGGLEVLLDGPLLPSRGNLMLKNSSFVEYDRNGLPLTVVFQLHILSLEVLREAVFGSLNNLQFLCENGRVHKFANSLCSLAFMLQEYMMERKVRSIEEVVRPSASGVYDLPKEFDTGANESGLSPPLCSTASCLQTWRSYVAELSRTLCSFMLTPECNRSGEVPVTTGSRSVMPTSSSYGELSLKWVMRVLFMMFPCIRAFSDQSVLPSHLRIFVTTFQKHVLGALRKVLALSAASLEILREEGLWDLIFSENFFYFQPCLEDSSGVLCKKSGESPTKHGTINLGNRKVLISGVEELQMEIISFVEFTASLNGSSHNMPECSAFLDALEQSACNPELASILGKSLLAVLQASTEKSVASFMKLDAVPRILKIVCIQAQEYRKSGTLSPNEGIECVVTVLSESDSYEMAQAWFKGMETLMELFKEFLLVEDDANNLVLHSSECIDCLFDLFWEERFRSRVLTHIHNLMKIIPVSEVDKKAKLQLCSKYLETFTQIKEREKYSAETSIELLVGMREMLLSNQKYYQDLFRDGECFLHVVSLLNGNLDEENAEKLVLNVLQTLTFLLASNDVSKAAFRSLVGKGYQTLQSLLLDFCQWQPNEGLLSALLDMLVDGRFDIKFNPVVKNEDVIMLYLSVLQKSSDRLQHNGLNIFQQLLKDSMSNRASCVRAGMLNFLLDWFSQEDDDSVILKIAHLIQVIGGHSISGKDIRKIFALLRSEKVGTRQHYCSLLLTSVLSMLNEKGPTAFFDMAGDDSGIKIETPLEWPLNRGYSFTCWLRVENIPRNGIMGLFSFLTESGKGCSAVLAMDKLIYDSINLKKQRVAIPVNLVQKKWHFLCLTHSIGRAFSGGSQLKCYVDGSLVTSDRCRYAKVNDLVTNCTVGARIKFPSSEEENATYSMNESSPFLGQIGPLYIFNDAITSEQVKGIYSLGPSYMYSFLDNEAALFCDPLPSGMLDAKDGLASKIIFGLNAQATNCRSLFNVSPMLENSVDKKSFKAMVMVGTQLCSRKLLQQTIYCVGGVSVFFPLISQSERYEDDNEDTVQSEDTLFIPISKERMTAEVIELIASVLDENLANQQQMHLLSGFSVLGFLLQSVPPQQLNLDTLSALKHMFSIVANCGWSDLLVEDAISRIFLNPVIWVYTVYKVQREVYLFLIQQFDNDPRLLKSMCRLPRVIDIVCQFYWDYSKSRSAISGKPLLHPITRKVIGERPNKEEIHKIRLLLLSLGEMSLRQNIQAADIKVLISFFETSQDMACIEDVLQMVIRAISQKTLLSSFLEEVNLLGGIQLFVNLLQRDHEPIRLLALQFLGRLLVGLPSEKKGSRFFYLNVGRSKSLSESQRNISLRMQPIFLAISDRIFRFQQTDNLCAMLFDVLLGGASPKQVLQKHNQLEKQRTKTNDTHFFLPQFLVLIFRYLANCNNSSIRMKVISDILDLLDSNTSNIEALMEYGWSAWLAAFVKLDVMKNYRADLRANDANEHILVRNLFCVVLCHYLYSLKGGWQQLEETVNFLVLHCRQVGISCQDLLRDIYDDLFKSLLSLSPDENIFFMQPCRDNTLYLLKLVDETLLSEMDHNLPFPASGSEPSLDLLQSESQRDLSSALVEALRGESDDQKRSNSNLSKQPAINVGDHIDEKWWNFYDTVWIILSEMNGKGPSKTVPKSVASAGPSFGQRARGLVESLNIPAAEMAAVVVSGGISNALSGKPSKNVDKAMLLRGEKGPRIVYRLVILYICRSSLERASRCAQQVISLLPYFLSADDEHGKTKLQFFIWSLLTVRSQYGILNDAARFHVISHLIRETVNCGKSLLVSSIAGRDNLADSGSNSKESSTIHNLIQKDRVVAAVADEVKYIKDMKADRAKQLSELSIRMDESLAMESNLKKVFEDELHISLNTILASDDHRRAVFQLGHDEMQQNVAEKWIHMFRALIDERGPWSANPFPNRSVIHWKLDKTEDTWRRRQKLRRNYHFDEKLCFPPSTETFLPVAESKPGFGGHISKQMKQFLLKGVHRITDEGNSEPNDVDSDANGQHLISEDPSDSSSSEPLKDASDQRNIVQDRKDTSTSSTETETSEVLKSVQCIIVTPKRKLAGRLAVMKNVLHFFGEFLVEGTGGSSVFKNFGALSNSDSTKLNQLAGVQKQKLQRFSLRLDLESDNEIAEDGLDNFHENILKKQAKKVKRHRRWNICKIKAVHWTRYLLRYTAIEIFFHDSVAPVFLNFASQKDAKDVGTLIVATRNESFFPKGNYKEKNGAISFVDRHVALEIAEVTREKWRRREITNFDYLMILNTLSGRSYNDLTQYPVFPWILADYSSEALDFNKSSTFRDLSKPVGALDSKRFEVFDDRYRNFSDPDIPSFYYGSHYSSMGIVLYYLLRLEPFTALHRNLQGGKFDHADRLFQSIESTYRNCLSNTSDVKELIPEFFYMPEFLVNSNSYHLGVKQDGELLCDVCLPPWAKGSPEEFINRNREALESEYVSSNLHHWIDLVFGYKQRGKPAVEAANIFYYLTYEGAVDLDAMEDELQRSAIEDQIANFGQTPIQIFRKKHPRRGLPIPISHPLYFAPASINLTSTVSSTNHLPSALLYISLLDSNIVLVNQGLTMAVKMWLTTPLQSGGNLTFSGSQDPLFGIGYDILSPRKIGSPLAEGIDLGAQCFATLHTPAENFIISCGNWENSFQVISMGDGRMVQSIRQHKDVVSCVAVTSDGSVLATGSFDTTVMVWEVTRNKGLEKKARSAQIEVPRKDYVVQDAPFHILCAHDDVITCLYVSTELDIVISGSRDGTCVFHTLRGGRYVRSLCHPSGCALSKLVASRHGHVVFYAEDDLSLHLYSINGKHLATSESNGRLNCLELSCCGEFLVCAGDQGQIVVRAMNSLEVVRKYNGVGKVITSLTVTPEECFLVGTKDGTILVYSIENPQLRKSGPLRNAKSKAPNAG